MIRPSPRVRAAALEKTRAVDATRDSRVTCGARRPRARRGAPRDLRQPRRRRLPDLARRVRPPHGYARRLRCGGGGHVLGYGSQRVEPYDCCEDAALRPNPRGKRKTNSAVRVDRDATQAYTKSIELIADQFREIDLQDGSRDRQLSGKDVRFFLLGAGLSKAQAVRVWEQLDENGNGKISYPEFKAWASDRFADVAVDDINYTTRSNVNVGQIRAKAAAKIGA